MLPIRENVLAVQDAIATKLRSLGRDPQDTILVAVTKTHPVEMIDAALKAGITHWGENKVQEAVRKHPFVTEEYGGFHFIGHLQTNKINALLSLNPLLIHSVGSLRLAQKLNSTLGRMDRIQDILIQVNVTDEDSKSGVDMESARELVLEISRLPFLRIRGLMTIGLMSPDAQRTRPYFQEMKQLFDSLKALDDPAIDMSWLSMGMSDDYLVALEEGANMLRLGSVIFGARDYGGKR